MSPKVSVIIAAHNHAHFLPECLNSVRRQSYADYEVIVIDNGSTDNTREVVAGLSWDKLRYHYQQDTGSVAGPRNTGIKLARGEYVAFLDSDDYWEPDKLKQTMAILEQDRTIDVVSHDLLAKNESGGSFLLPVGPLKDDMYRQLLFCNRLLGSATVAKKSVMEEIGGFDGRPEFVHAEDYEAWLRLAEKRKKFSFLNKVLGTYRIHGQNLSSDYERALQDEVNVLKTHLKRYPFKNAIDKFVLPRRIMGRIYYWIGTKHLQNGRWFKGAFYLARAIALSPEYFLRLFSSLKKYLLLRSGRSTKAAA
ncbi:MAG: glycosyltransferase [Candidatus Saganbacteria bacterium]|nr:glycosyltransferase [Candidatus Saganbacteria bacterium]